MIELKYLRESFEKLAEEKVEIKIPVSKKDAFALRVLKAISGVISGGAKLFVKHPMASTLGVGALAGGTYLAAKVLPGYTMVNETRKRALMKDQLGYLQQMAAVSNMQGRQPDINPDQQMRPAIEPLA
jgi:hypothetical protein